MIKRNRELKLPFVYLDKIKVMTKETKKFIFQVLVFSSMVAFALAGRDGWATAMLLMLFFAI